MWFVLGFGTACGLCAYTWHLDHLLLPTAACVLLFAILTAIVRHHKTLRRFAVIALGCAAGFGWFHLYSSLYLQDSAKLDGAVQQAEIICTDYSVPSDYGSYAEGYITVDGKPYRVRVSLKEDLQIAPGDELLALDGDELAWYKPNELRLKLLQHRGPATLCLRTAAGEERTVELAPTLQQPKGAPNLPKDRKAFFEAGKVKGSKEALVDSGNYPTLFEQADPTYAQPSARERHKAPER